MNQTDRLRNIFPRNPTQTALIRFMRTPRGEVRSAFSDAQDEFGRQMEGRLKTAYSELWQGDKR